MQFKTEALKNTKCVIFDMDGVIIDSEFIHKKAYYETFTSLGIEVSEELYKTITGSSTLNAFQKLVTRFKLNLDPSELVLKKRNYYINYFESDPSLKLVDGVHEIIKYFFDKGMTLILASSSSMPNINRVFDRFELNQYFTGKISGADLKESKPHPEIFEKASIMANISKEECVIIEDSDNGIEAANKAGIFVFGYSNPMSSDQTLENANKVIREFKDLKEFI
ncbi:HAD family hydrolase [Tenacibaculum xiamenense]|uniref:HAD family hydrolase n=1 Tax=Tenacibaculum xiamenense TaxID=1261553 RepID=UPI0038939799